MAKLQGIVLSELTERLNTLVSALVRIKKCESVGNPLLALEDLVHLLGKIKRCVNAISNQIEDACTCVLIPRICKRRERACHAPYFHVQIHFVEYKGQTSQNYKCLHNHIILFAQFPPPPPIH